MLGFQFHFSNSEANITDLTREGRGGGKREGTRAATGKL